MAASCAGSEGSGEVDPAESATDGASLEAGSELTAPEAGAEPVAPASVASDEALLADMDATARPKGGAEVSEPAGAAEPSSSDEGGRADVPVSADRCAPLGVNRSPRTIGELVELANALPKPTSLPCFLISLERPLTVSLTSSGFSAQPSPGARSPRVFLTLGPLVLSVVPAGAASHALEFGLRTGAGRSVKGEIAFPLREPLDSEALHERVDLVVGTVCGGCHSSERRVSDAFYEQAFESSVIVPSTVYEVSLQSLAQERESCQPEHEAERCAMLSALLDHGPLEPLALDQWIR